MTELVALKGEAREVALAEAQTVLAMAQDDEMRARLAELVSEVDDGERRRRDAPSCSSRCSSSACRPGRIRAYYGPGGEQAALATLRRLPRGRARARERARGVARRCGRSTGQPLDAVQDRRGRAGRVHALDRGRRVRGVGAPRRQRRAADEPRDMSDVRHYMACLDLRGRDCLVVGGGRVATEKVHGLLDCERERHRRRAAGRRRAAPRCRCAIERRAFRRSDVVGRFLVIAATSDRARQRRRLERRAPSGATLCNVADDPELCSFILPAIVRRDPIVVGVSTGGASPALAQRHPRRHRRARRPGACRARAAARRHCGRGRRRAADLRGAARLLPAARRGGAGVSVAIVGAGPGDPGLVTVRALELVRDCEILVYDRLVASGARREGDRRGAHLARRADAGGGERAARAPRPPRPQGRAAEGRRPVHLRARLRRGRGARRGRDRRTRSCPASRRSRRCPALAGIPLTTRGVAAQLTVAHRHARATAATSTTTTSPRRPARS